MKQLETNFIGKGQVKGFIFTQIKKSKCAYIYKVHTGYSEHYEVFKHKENSHFNCVSYPSDKAFGIWAWSCSNLDKALIKFEELNDRGA
jgi:hypothetical protein